MSKRDYVQQRQPRYWQGILPIVGLLVGSLLTSHSVAQDAEPVEWEFLSKDGVAERRPQPEPQVVDLAVEEMPLSITVESEVLGSGSGKVVEIDLLSSQGGGGQLLTRDFDFGVGVIKEGPDGHIWIATSEGLCRFDGQTWILYTAEDGIPHLNGKTFISDMEFDQAGHLWLVGRKGIAQFDGQRWIWYQMNIDTRSVAVSPNGDIWTGGGRSFRTTPEGDALDEPLLYRFDGSDWWEYSSKDGLPIEGQIQNVDVNQAGVVWANIWPSEHKLISFDGTQTTSYRIPQGRRELFVDSKDRVWIGSGNSLFVKDGPNWKEYLRDEADNWAGVDHIYEDRFSRLWIGGSTWGVLEGTQWSFHSFEELNATANGFLIDRQGFHWVSTSSGSDRLLRWRPSLLPTSIDGNLNAPSPTGLQLNPNFPNPFNTQTIISFQLPRQQPLSLRVLNLSGQVVDTLLEGTFQPGSYSANWDGRTNRGDVVSSGFYVYQLSTKDRLIAGKMTLIK